ncbi:MAG: response regulator [Prochloraceae cyanobacterium]|nr:response regulator [Prochloraceae cyanobacterium]
MTSDLITTQIEKRLSYLNQEQFNGKLEITSKGNNTSVLYFRLGRLIWADGGKHPQRSWYRHQAKYCPQINLKPLYPDNFKQWESSQYQTLILNFQNKTISREQLKALIQSKIKEQLFDIFQEETISQLKYSAKGAMHSAELALMLENTPVLISTEEVLNETRNSWSQWVKKGLGFWSPNQAVKKIRPEQLNCQDLPKIPPQLIELLNGENTIRDLAVLCQEKQQDLVELLVPYLYQEVIKFTSVPDKINQTNNFTSKDLGSDRNLQSVILQGEELPLIVGIDDDREICNYLSEILTRAGYKYIGIENSWEALPKLVRYQPNLILIDTDMPIVDGYEIITQMRRIDSLQDTPVVMMTKFYALLDRIRSQLIGSEASIAKPINAFELLRTVQNVCLKKQKCKYAVEKPKKYRGVAYTQLT